MPYRELCDAQPLSTHSAVSCPAARAELGRANGKSRSSLAKEPRSRPRMLNGPASIQWTLRVDRRAQPASRERKHRRPLLWRASSCSRVSCYRDGVLLGTRPAAQHVQASASHARRARHPDIARPPLCGRRQRTMRNGRMSAAQRLRLFVCLQRRKGSAGRASVLRKPEERAEHGSAAPRHVSPAQRAEISCTALRRAPRGRRLSSHPYCSLRMGPSLLGWSLPA